MQRVEDSEEIIERVTAIDVGKAEVVVCIRIPDPARPGRRQQEIVHSSTLTPRLLVLADRLVELGVTRVVMEATSDYWKPVFYLLESRGLDPWLVNARDVKHLPGRPKTDRLDAVWLAKVAERQMLRASFVPPGPIRLLRDLTRYRAGLVKVRTAEKNRVEKLLEDAQIKLSSVVSDIFGVSGREMLAALLAGERRPAVLAQLARTRMRPKIPLLEEAFAGQFTEHHAFLLRLMLARIDEAGADIAAVEGRIQQLVAPFATVVARLDEIPGVGAAAAWTILAEIGLDMSRFPTSAHLCSWARYAPGVNQSAGKNTGKNKGRGATGHGNPYLGQPSPRPPWPPHAPTPSSATATDAWPAAAERREPPSRSDAPSWSSSGTCCLSPRPATTTSARTTPAAPTPTAPPATTSANFKPSATPSPSHTRGLRAAPHPTATETTGIAVVPFARPRLIFGLVTTDPRGLRGQVVPTTAAALACAGNPHAGEAARVHRVDTPVRTRAAA